MDSERYLPDVIDDVLAEVPAEYSDLRPEFKAHLTSIKESAQHCPPEGMGLWWKALMDTCQAVLGPPEGSAWRERIALIIENKVNAKAASGPGPSKEELLVNRNEWMERAMAAERALEKAQAHLSADEGLYRLRGRVSTCGACGTITQEGHFHSCRPVAQDRSEELFASIRFLEGQVKFFVRELEALRTESRLVFKDDTQGPTISMVHGVPLGAIEKMLNLLDQQGASLNVSPGLHGLDGILVEKGWERADFLEKLLAQKFPPKAAL